MTPRISRHRRIFLAGFCTLAVTLGGLSYFALPWILNSRPSLSFDEVHAEGTGRVRIKSPVTLLATPRLTLEAGVVSLAPGQNVDVASKEELVQHIEAGDLGLLIEGGTLRLKSTAAPVSVATGLAPLVVALTKPAFSSLTLKDCKLIIERTGGREEVLTGLSGHIDAAIAGPVKAEGQFALRSDRIAYNVSVGTKFLNAQKDELPIALELSGKHIEASASGKLVLANALQLIASKSEIKFADPQAAANWLGLNWPSLPGTGPVTIAGALDWLGDTVTVSNANISINEQKATGSVSVTARPQRPLLEGTLAFEELDLAGIVVPKSPDSGPATGTQASIADLQIENFLPKDPAQSLLHQLDADFRLSATHLAIDGIDVGRAAGSIATRSGVANITLAELENDAGDTGHVEVEIDTNGNVASYKLKGQISAIETSRIMTALFGYPVMTGAAEANANLAATGKTLPQLRESLDGTIKLSAPAGISIATDLFSLIHKSGSKPHNGWAPATGASQLQLDTFTAQLTAARGHLKINSFEGTAGQQKLIGTGTADLASQSIDLELQAHTPAPPRTALKAGTINVKAINVQGEWPNPTIRAAPTGKRSDTPGPIRSKPQT